MSKLGDRVILPVKVVRKPTCQATFKEHDPIQDKCHYGYVLPDRCRYMRHMGCPCGAYPPIKQPIRD